MSASPVMVKAGLPEGAAGDRVLILPGTGPAVKLHWKAGPRQWWCRWRRLAPGHVCWWVSLPKEAP